MTKFIPLLLLAACSKDPNLAEIRVKSDVPDAGCLTAKFSDGTYVVKCTIPTEDNTPTTIIAAQGNIYPFQYWPIKTAQQERDAAKKARPAAPLADPTGPKP